MHALGLELVLGTRRCRTATRRLRPAELLDALRRHEVDFVVIGGFSLAAHGYVRATKDLDIVPDPDAESLARLADVLAGAG